MRTFKNQSSMGSCMGRLSRQHNSRHNMLVSTSKRADPYFKQLLLDIEKSNVPREDLTFGTLCRLRPTYYDVDESKKKKYKNEFDQIKRRTPTAYIKLLDTFGIELGPVLQRTIRKKGTPASSSKKPVRVSSFSSSSSASSSSSDSSSDDSVAKITERFKDISIPKATTPTPKEIESSVEQPPISILKKKIMFSPSDTGDSATSKSIADVLYFVELLESTPVRQDGTVEFPYIHIVNHEFPERNRWIDITFVPEIVRRGHTRDVIDIRWTVPVGNADHWAAFIPLARYPTLASRSVMIRGPSQDFFTQDTERYHADKTTLNCESTKKKHSATEQAIKDDPYCQLSHILLVFKKDITLENHVFSDDAVYVNVEVNDMEATIDNGGEKLNVMGTTLFCRIAVAGGSKLASKKPKRARKLFNKPGEAEQAASNPV